MKISIQTSKILGTLNNQYTLLEKLDFGATSMVYKVLDNKTGEIKVAKIFSENSNIAFQKEIDIFKSISDLECVIKIFAYGNGILSKEGNEVSINYIILEYAKGSLLKYMENLNNVFSLDTIIYLSYQFIKAIDCLHKKGISHRDLKIENVLLVGNNFSVKLCDFGLSKSFINENKKKIKFKDPELVGSPFHYPPEILNKKAYEGEKSDIFSSGISLFSLMTGRFPFEEATIKDKVYKLICLNKIKEFWDLVDRDNLLSSQFKDLFIKMVAYYPKERPSLDEILNFPFFEKLRNPNEETIAYYQNIIEKELGKINI